MRRASHSVGAMVKRHISAMILLMLLNACVTPSSHDPGTGARLFGTYCTSCHGANARGDGIANPYLKVTAPDLTLIAARRGGRFAAEEIYKIIDGQSSVDFYDHRHMPIWGYDFYGNDADDERAHREAGDRVTSLVAYLETIQRQK
jgi:mono/diheme cytochrome c family protein